MEGIILAAILAASAVKDGERELSINKLNIYQVRGFFYYGDGRYSSIALTKRACEILRFRERNALDAQKFLRSIMANPNWWDKKSCLAAAVMHLSDDQSREYRARRILTIVFANLHLFRMKGDDELERVMADLENNQPFAWFGRNVELEKAKIQEVGVWKI